MAIMGRKTSEAAAVEGQVTAKQIQDEDKLAELGYRQELKRDWSMLHNFGVSFSIIVSLTSRREGRPFHQLRTMINKI